MPHYHKYISKSKFTELDLRSQEAVVNKNFLSFLPMISVSFMFHLHFSATGSAACRISATPEIF